MKPTPTTAPWCPALAALFVLTNIGLGCGPTAEDVPFVRTERSFEDTSDADGDVVIDLADMNISDVPLEDWDTSEAGPLTGIFAVEAVVRANVGNELVAIPVESRQLYRVRILQHGQTVRHHTTLCRFILPSVEGLAELEIPAALEVVMQDKTDERETEALSSADPIGATYAPGLGVILLGAELADPDNDPLPTSDNPELAMDEDGDGQPGVTVLASTLTCDQQEELYVAIRTGAELIGTVQDIDTIVGDVVPVLDQSVLGYSHDCMAAAARLPITVAEGSTFVAYRVGDTEDLDGNGNVSCQEIGIGAVELFGEQWANAE